MSEFASLWSSSMDPLFSPADIRLFPYPCRSTYGLFMVLRKEAVSHIQESREETT
jgi:hypothetical protein